MPLRPRLDSLEGVDEALQAHYAKQDDGTYLLDVTQENGWALRDVDKLMRALENERAAGRKATETLKAYDGLDVKAARDALKQVEEWSAAPPDEKVKKAAEARERELIRAHEEAMGKKDARTTRLQSQLTKIMLTDRARDAIREAKGNEDLLLPHVTAQLRLREDEDAWVTEVINSEGAQRLKDSGTPLSVAELVEEMRGNPRYQPAFAGMSAGGGGAAAGGEGGGGPRPTRTIKRNDPDLNFHLEDIASGKITVVD